MEEENKKEVYFFKRDNKLVMEFVGIGEAELTRENVVDLMIGLKQFLEDTKDESSQDKN